MACCKLVIMIMSGPDDGQEIHLSQEHGDGYTSEDGAWSLMLGRREECDLTVPFDTQVSRQHALLQFAADGTVWLIDKGSLNGTFVGQMRVEKPTVLERGQLFRVGRTWLRIQPETDEA